MEARTALRATGISGPIVVAVSLLGVIALGIGAYTVKELSLTTPHTATVGSSTSSWSAGGRHFIGTHVAIGPAETQTHNEPLRPRTRASTLGAQPASSKTPPNP
jgi:hypothetical protein